MSIYSSYYVLQVKTNREHYIKQIIDEYSNKDIESIIFKKEMIHINKKKESNIFLPLFPGYIFINKKIDDVIKLLKILHINEHFSPVSFNNVPARVYEDEMDFLLSICDSKGIIRVSRLTYHCGERINIVDGPLKSISGKIEFLNYKKKKAKIKIKLLQRELDVSLGIDFIKKCN